MSANEGICNFRLVSPCLRVPPEAFLSVVGSRPGRPRSVPEVSVNLAVLS